jgi:hypothetical protein
VKSENHCPLTALCFDLSCGENFIVNFSQNKDDGVLWKGALAIGGGTAAVLAIVTRGFNNDHPNYLCPSISALDCRYIIFCQLYMAT